MKRIIKVGFGVLLIVLVVGFGVSYYLTEQSQVSRVNTIVSNLYMDEGEVFLREGITPKDFDTVSKELGSLSQLKFVDSGKIGQIQYRFSNAQNKYKANDMMRTLYDTNELLINKDTALDLSEVYIRRTVTRDDIERVREVINLIEPLSDAYTITLVGAFNYVDEVQTFKEDVQDSLTYYRQIKDTQVLKMIEDYELKLSTFKDERILRDTKDLITSVKAFQSKQ